MTTVITGWGMNSTVPKDPGQLGDLKEGNLKTIPNSECKKFNKKWKPYVISENMICAVNPKEGSCKGDSGSPMITLGKNGTYQQIGIASFGGFDKDKNGTVLSLCSLKSPVVYSRVTVQLNWIKMMMKK